MTGPACMCGPVSKQAAGQASKVTVSILPAALLLILPKCPLCLAAWLTMATGFGITADSVNWVRAGLVLTWMAALASIARRRNSGSYPAFFRRRP